MDEFLSLWAYAAVRQMRNHYRSQWKSKVKCRWDFFNINRIWAQSNTNFPQRNLSYQFMFPFLSWTWTSLETFLLILFGSKCNKIWSWGVHTAVMRTTGPLYVLVGTGEVTLKAKHVWHVVYMDDARGFSTWLQIMTSGERSATMSDPEYEQDVACSIIAQDLGKVLFACVMRFQKDLKKSLTLHT